jgi:hypothetical protein
MNQHLANIDSNTAAMKDYMRAFTFGSGRNFDRAVSDRDLMNSFFRMLAEGVG